VEGKEDLRSFSVPGIKAHSLHEAAELLLAFDPFRPLLIVGCFAEKEPPLFEELGNQGMFAAVKGCVERPNGALGSQRPRPKVFYQVFRNKSRACGERKEQTQETFGGGCVDRDRVINGPTFPNSADEYEVETICCDTSKAVGFPALSCRYIKDIVFDLLNDSLVGTVAVRVSE
jgi:hypothetical protein